MTAGADIDGRVDVILITSPRSKTKSGTRTIGKTYKETKSNGDKNRNQLMNLLFQLVFVCVGLVLAESSWIFKKNCFIAEGLSLTAAAAAVSSEPKPEPEPVRIFIHRHEMNKSESTDADSVNGNFKFKFTNFSVKNVGHGNEPGAGDRKSVTGSSGDNNKKTKDIEIMNKMQCVCDGNCEWLREGECPWGVTLDFCGCCLLCSRGEGEPCGGAVGTCAKGLVCHSAVNNNNDSTKGSSFSDSDGKCSRLAEVRIGNNICKNPLARFGCVFHDGDCFCENHILCPPMEIFLFQSKQECWSRISLLTRARGEWLPLPYPLLTTKENEGRIKSS